MTDYTAAILGTLAWCNERRAEKGLPPLDDLPRGARRDLLSCPCGKATGLRVTSATYTDKTRRKPPKLLPSVVSDFIMAFDCGLLPQYDEDA
jgi:hypothetical protein